MNDNKHSTAKVASFRAIMNVDNRDLIYKIKRIRLKEVKRRRYYRSLKKALKEYLILLYSSTKSI